MGLIHWGRDLYGSSALILNGASTCSNEHLPHLHGTFHQWAVVQSTTRPGTSRSVAVGHTPLNQNNYTTKPTDQKAVSAHTAPQQAATPIQAAYCGCHHQAAVRKRYLGLPGGLPAVTHVTEALPSGEQRLRRRNTLVHLLHATFQRPGCLCAFWRNQVQYMREHGICLREHRVCEREQAHACKQQHVLGAEPAGMYQ